MRGWLPTTYRDAESAVYGFPSMVKIGLLLDARAESMLAVLEGAGVEEAGE